MTIIVKAVAALSVGLAISCSSDPTASNDHRKLVMLPGGDNARIAMHYADFPSMTKVKVPVADDGAFEFSGLDSRGSLVVLEVLPTDAFDESTMVAGEPSIEFGAEDALPSNALTIVTQQDVESGPVHVTMLSDYIGRMVHGHLAVTPPARVRALQDTISEQLVKRDINMDGQISYDDVLAFDPSNERHLDGLNFHYPTLIDHVASDCNCSIRDAYNHADAQALESAFNDILDSWVVTSLPSLNAAGVTKAQIAAGFGGTVSIDELPGVVLNADNPIYNVHSTFDTFDKLTLRATPEDHYTVKRWVGCPALQADGSCTLLPSDAELAVEAQFSPPEILQSNVPSVVKLLTFASDTYRTDLVGDRLRIIVVANSPLDGALQTGAVVSGAIATNLGARPLAQITAVAQPRTAMDASNVEYQFDTMEVTPDKVYASIASFESTEPLAIEDVSQMVLRVFPTSRLARLAGANNQAIDPRDGKVEIVRKPIWLLGYGKAIEVAPQLYMINDPQTKKLRFARAVGAPEVLSAAESARAVLRSCRRDPRSVDCQVVGILPSRAGQQMSYLDAPCTLWSMDKFCPIQATLTRDFGALRVQVTFEAFLGIQANGSINFGPGAFVNGDSRGVIEAGLAMKTFVGLGGSVDGGFQCSGSNGPKPLPTFSNAKTLAESGGASAAANSPVTQADQMAVAKDAAACTKFVENDRAAANKQDKEVADVSTEIVRPTPDGALMPLKVGFKVGVEALGNLGLEVTVFTEAVTYWDANFVFGKRCRRWGVFDCDPWKFDINGTARFRANSKLAIDVIANGSVSPYAGIYIGTGVRGIKEDLIRVEGRATAELELVGGYAGLRYTSLRSDRAQGLSGWCMEGKGSLMLGAKAKAGIYAIVDAKFEKELPFGIKLDIGQKFTIAKTEEKRQLLDPTPIIKETPVDLGLGGIPMCRPLAENVEGNPKELIWKPGELNWSDTPDFGATKTHQLIMQEDGNLVLYKFLFDSDGKVSDKQPVWNSGTAGHFGARAQFQRDGNFVVYDIREQAIWNSSTHGKGVTSLKLQSDGNLVIYQDSRALWSSNTSDK